jgi:hypothetical protein
MTGRASGASAHSFGHVSICSNDRPFSAPTTCAQTLCMTFRRTMRLKSARKSATRRPQRTSTWISSIACFYCGNVAVDMADNSIQTSTHFVQASTVAGTSRNPVTWATRINQTATAPTHSMAALPIARVPLLCVLLIAPKSFVGAMDRRRQPH